MGIIGIFLTNLCIDYCELYANASIEDKFITTHGLFRYK